MVALEDDGDQEVRGDPPPPGRVEKSRTRRVTPVGTPSASDFQLNGEKLVGKFAVRAIVSWMSVNYSEHLHYYKVFIGGHFLLSAPEVVCDKAAAGNPVHSTASCRGVVRTHDSCRLPHALI